MKNVTPKLGLVVAGLLAAAIPAHGQTRSQVYGPPLAQEAQTVYVRADVGMTTYESQAANSKETLTSTSTMIGGWAGEERLVGVSITSTEATVPFELNDSSMHTAFRDVRMMARFGWLIPSIGVSLTEIGVDQGQEQTIGIYSTGASAGLGVQVPVAPFMIVEGDAMAVKSTKVYDKLGNDTKLGQRIDANVDAVFDVTDRLVDFLVGYKVREYDIETAGKQYNEKAQGVYAGLRFGLYF